MQQHERPQEPFAGIEVHLGRALKIKKSNEKLQFLEKILSIFDNLNDNFAMSKFVKIFWNFLRKFSQTFRKLRSMHLHGVLGAHRVY